MSDTIKIKPPKSSKQRRKDRYRQIKIDISKREARVLIRQALLER